MKATSWLLSARCGCAPTRIDDFYADSHIQSQFFRRSLWDNSAAFSAAKPSSDLLSASVEWLSIFDQFAVRCLEIEGTDHFGDNCTQGLGWDAIVLLWGNLGLR
jgi:hypothetical protein